VALNDQGVCYRGTGSAAAALPGRQQAFEVAAWTAQLDRWRAQLEELVAEFDAGDVRIRLAAADLADGPYAALTRIREFSR
jgi:hypothetical protein